MSRLRLVLRTAAASALATGILCQFVQDTDPAPAASYFTVWSAVLALGTLVVGTARRPGAGSRLDDVAVTGVVFSGLVYATVIAPRRPHGAWVLTSDDIWVSIATVLLHGVAPVLLLADSLMSRRVATRPWRDAWVGCAWPALYLAVITIVHALGGPPIPYEFLDPVQTPPAAVAAAGIVLGAAFAGVGRLIEAGRGAAARIT